MILVPTISTRTVTRFPYTPIFRFLFARDDVGAHAIGVGALEAPGTQLLAGLAGGRRRRATEGERGAVVGDPLAEAHEERAAVVELQAHALVGDLREIGKAHV